MEGVPAINPVFLYRVSPDKLPQLKERLPSKLYS
nr:MAG TPA: hypothetical protein [Caudoviricetes sp.]